MMRVRRIHIGFILLAFLFLSGTLARAQSVDRTWVSGIGDDSNSCSRTAPCRTYAGAIGKTNPGGEIDALDAGGFGTVVISKSVTISGYGSLASILAGGNGNGININAGANDTVVLRNLSIRSVVQSGSPGANGVKVTSAKAVYLIDCVIENFSNDGIDFEPTSGGSLYVRDSFVINNGIGGAANGAGTRAGVFIKAASGAAYASIDNTKLDGNAVGINARDNSKVTVSGSVISRNSITGLLAASDSNAPAEMNVERTVVTLNGNGIGAGGCTGSGAAVVRIANVSVTSNISAGLIIGVVSSRNCGRGSIISSKNNTILGNNPDGTPTQTIVQQ